MPATSYGEWYSDVPLSGNASPGDTLESPMVRNV